MLPSGTAWSNKSETPSRVPLHFSSLSSKVKQLLCFVHFPSAFSEGQLLTFLIYSKYCSLHPSARGHSFTISSLKYEVLVTQSCPALCGPMDRSLPGSSVHGIHQARMLEWVAMPFFRGSSWPRGQTRVSYTAGRFFTIWATRKPE